MFECISLKSLSNFMCIDLDTAYESQEYIINGCDTMINITPWKASRLDGCIIIMIYIDMLLSVY